MVESTRGAQGEGTTPFDFCLRLTRAHALLTRRLDNRLSALHGLSFGDFLVLYYLNRAPDGKLRRIDLAERLGLTASGVTRTLLPLEKLGWVSRQPDPRDARVAYAKLTKPGEQLLSNAATSAVEVCEEATAAVPADRVEAMAAALGQLAGLHSANR